MKKVSLSGVARTHVGKTDAKALRNDQKVPAVIYGGAANQTIFVEYIDLNKIVYSPEAYQVNITVDGKEVPTVMREVQFHPVTDKIMHADFLELIPGKDVVVEIPIRFNGTSKGVRQGGKLSKTLRKIKVKATPENMPDYVNVSIENLDLGQTLKVKDIKIENAKLIESMDRAIASVKTTRNVAAAAEAAAPAKKK
jgi:large subunit ribosomal protein L25